MVTSNANSDAINGIEEMECLLSELKTLITQSQTARSSENELSRTQELIKQFRDLAVPLPDECTQEVTPLSRRSLTASLFMVGREAHLASNKKL